jgi:hypothetical protein
VADRYPLTRAIKEADTMAASIADVFDELEDLSSHMWRGHGDHPGPGATTLPGMVPELSRAVSALTDRIGGIEKQVADTGSLLIAVNEQTLGRIESALNAGVLFLGNKLIKVEGDVDNVRQSVATVSQDIVTLNARVDGLEAVIQKNLAALLELHAKVDGITKDIAGLPRNP